MKTRRWMGVFLVFFSMGLAGAAPERADKLRKAAEQGVANAQYGLGIAYWLGEGAPKDAVEALAWLNLASASGCEPARGWRDSLEKELNKNQLAEATQRARERMAGVQRATRAKDATP